MKPNGSTLRSIQLLACLFFLLPCFSAYGAEVVKPAPGTQLPQFNVGVPDSPKVQKYLGLKNNKPFKLVNINGKMVIINFISVFWPICQKDTPVVNRLYNLIQEDAELARDIKLIGIACTNTQDLVDNYKTLYRISYPIFPDKNGDVYLPAGVSVTPTMVVTTPGGKVLMSRKGGIEDFDKLVKELRDIHKKL